MVAPFKMQMESQKITFEMVNRIPAGVAGLEESYLANWELIS